MKNAIPRLLALSVGITLFSCGGSGGSGGGTTATQGLTTPNELQVVTPVDTTGSGGSYGSGAATDGFDPGSDYFQDEARVYVYDAALEPLNLVNMILNYMGQTASDQLVNEGYYTALIDPSLAEAGGGESDGTGQSAGEATEYEVWTVGSTRANDSAPQYVSVWVPDDDPTDDWDQVIRVRTVVTDGVSDTNPFGQFTLNFAGINPVGGTVSDPQMLGVLETNDPTAGNVGFSFYQEEGDINVVPQVGERAGKLQVNVSMSPDQSTGEAKIFRQERFDWGMGDSGIISEEYLVAFNNDYFLRQTDGANEVVYSRTNYDEMVWRYILYYADGPQAGSRVDLNSGFSIRTQDGSFGSIGYWGLWLPDGAVVNDGDTVIRDVWGEVSEDVPYTVVKAPGKLVKHEKNTIPVADVEGDQFRWWAWDEGTGETNEYIITYLAGQWVELFLVDWSTGETTPIDPPVVIDTATIGYLNMWSDSLGGPAAWIFDDPLVVTYFKQTFVNSSSDLFAGGAAATLYGFVDCLRTGLLATEVEVGDIYLPNAPDVATPHQFVFSQDDLTLYHDPSGTGNPLVPVGLATGEVPASGPYTWGMQTGPLLTDPSGLVDVWDVWNQNVFYVYETGANPWNWYVGLLDALGDPVVFDPPIQFTYTHSTLNDRNGDATFDGKTFFLDYGGPGDLWGLPQEGVDLNGDGTEDRWYPVVNLADGILLGPTGTEYVVKAYEIEQSLQEDPTGNGVLDVVGASDLVLPDGSNYDAPDIGPEPTVTDPPRVIAGEVVDGGTQ